MVEMFSLYAPVPDFAVRIRAYANVLKPYPARAIRRAFGLHKQEFVPGGAVLEKDCANIVAPFRAEIAKVESILKATPADDDAMARARLASKMADFAAQFCEKQESTEGQSRLMKADYERKVEEIEKTPADLIDVEMSDYLRATLR